MYWMSSERLMYVQFTPSVQGIVKNMLAENKIKKIASHTKKSWVGWEYLL